MRIARGLKADQENDFEIYTNDSLKSAFLNVAGVVSIGAFVISFIALVAAGIGIMNIMLVSVTDARRRLAFANRSAHAAAISSGNSSLRRYLFPRPVEFLALFWVWSGAICSRFGSRWM